LSGTDGGRNVGRLALGHSHGRRGCSSGVVGYDTGRAGGRGGRLITHGSGRIGGRGGRLVTHGSGRIGGRGGRLVTHGTGAVGRRGSPGLVILGARGVDCSRVSAVGVRVVPLVSIDGAGGRRSLGGVGTGGHMLSGARALGGGGGNCSGSVACRVRLVSGTIGGLRRAMRGGRGRCRITVAVSRRASCCRDGFGALGCCGGGGGSRRAIGTLR
jgi:hypothetical protein